MAKSVAAGVKAAWELAKKDFKENAHTDLLKQDVIDVLDMAKNKASLIKKNSSQANKVSVQSGKIGPRVNPDVGAELLTYFKEQWAEIHGSTEAGSKAASKMDFDLRQLSQSINKSHSIISRCNEEFGRLKEVIEALDEAQSKVDYIGKLVAQVEQDIREYSLAKAELGAERQRHLLQRQHEATVAEDREKVDQLRKVLGNEQQLSLNLRHEVESSKLRDRQDAFQEMFEKQMADYRTSGELEKPLRGSGQPGRERSQSQLEEVVIEDEDGTASLHEFLSDVVLEDEGKEQEQQEEKAEVETSEISSAPEAKEGGEGEKDTPT